VDISASHAGPGRFRLAVKDSGIGIKPGEVPRLFKEFEQLEAGTARRFEGTGLGLALYGASSVESEPGRGSTFAVTLSLLVRNAPVAIGS
jgi:signal transduction histidine kinase